MRAMKLEEAKSIVTPHLVANEVAQHISLGYLHRPWKPLVAWAPLWILVLYRVLGGETGALDWVIMLGWAFLVNALLIRRYLIVTTNERFLLIAMKRLRSAGRNYSSWPLAQVCAEGLKESRSGTRFDLQTPARRLKLEFGDVQLEGNKSSATATYQALQKGRDQASVPVRTRTEEETGSTPAWLRKEHLQDRTVIIVAMAIPIVMLGRILLQLPGQDWFQESVASLRRKIAAPLSLRVPDAYTPSIVVPICQKQREEGKIVSNTYLCMASSAGDLLGEGKTWIYVPASAAFSAEFCEYNNFVTVSVGELGPGWRLEFAPPKAQAWIVGLYQDAERFPFQEASRPGLSVHGYGSGCSDLSGRFEILELECDRSASRVTRFAANFEQRCHGGPPLLGLIRVNSTVGP